MMNGKTCRHCGNLIPLNVSKCPYCHEVQPRRRKETPVSALWMMIIGDVMVLLVLFVGIGWLESPAIGLLLLPGAAVFGIGLFKYIRLKKRR